MGAAQSRLAIADLVMLGGATAIAGGLTLQFGIGTACIFVGALLVFFGWCASN